jgi:hypothetical protein
VKIEATPLASLRISAGASRLRALARGNRLFAFALGGGAFLRLLAMIGYPGVLWFPGDSYVYLGAALRLRPDLSKSTGYSLFLRALEPFHSLIVVSLVQHLMGLAVAVMMYALLRRARVSLRWATVATLPVLFDGFQIELEHMVMAETLFTFLVMVAMTLLLWPARPSWPATLLAGLLVGYAVTVRTEGLPVPVLLAAFLLLRRMGWRQVTAIVAGSAVPILAYMAWFHSWTGDYGLTRSDGFYLWGRVSSFAECSVIKPPADERKLCLTTPVADRKPPGSLIWHAPQVHQLAGGPVSAANNRLLRDFAIRAVEAQPLAYAHAIVNGIGLAVDWRRYKYPSAGTVAAYNFHLHPQVVPDHSWIHGGTAAQDAHTYGGTGPSRVIEPFAVLIAGYQRLFYTYGPLFGAILLTGLGGLIRVQRRPRVSREQSGSREQSDSHEQSDSRRPVARIQRYRGGGSMLPWVTAVVLLVFPIAAADFDYRYLLPVLPFACLAAGLAFAPSAKPGASAVPATAAEIQSDQAQPEFS